MGAPAVDSVAGILNVVPIFILVCFIVRMVKGDKLSIQLVGGPPWGFRLGGGADFGCPLEIAKVRRSLTAYNKSFDNRVILSKHYITSN